MTDTTSQSLSEAELSDEQINEIWSALDQPLSQSRLSAFGLARIRAILAKQREMDAKAAIGEVVGFHRVGFRDMATVSWKTSPEVGTLLFSHPPAAQDREPLSEGDLLRAIQSIGPDGHGRIALTYESGPYDIGRPTNVAIRLCRAIEQVIKELQR